MELDRLTEVLGIRRFPATGFAGIMHINAPFVTDLVGCGGTEVGIEFVTGGVAEPTDVMGA